MAESFWVPQTHPKVPEAGDFVILGGGFVGLSAAYWLRKLKPKAKIVVLERDELGKGASGKNAGFLTKGSQAFYRSLENRFGALRAEEIFQYTSESLSLLQQEVLRYNPGLATPASSITFGEESALGFGNFRWDAAHGAWVSPGEYRVHPVRLLQFMRAQLETLNVSILEGVEAICFSFPQRLETNRGTISFEKALIALNGYAPQFHSELRQKIFPKRAQMLAVRVSRDLGAELFYHPRERVYWRMVDQETLIIGGKRLSDEVEENSDFEKINFKVQSALEAYLSQNLKISFDVLKRWSGIMGFTASELPLVEAFSVPNTFIAAGFSGHGMGMGFRTGKEVAMLMTGEKNMSLFGKV